MELDKLLGDLTIVGDDTPPPTLMPAPESHPSAEGMVQVKEFLRSVHEQFGFGPVAELFENYKL